MTYFSDLEEPPDFLKALDRARRLSVGEGCWAHVQAIQTAIDQYAEAATGNRDFFLHKPQKIG